MQAAMYVSSMGQVSRQSPSCSRCCTVSGSDALPIRRAGAPARLLGNMWVQRVSERCCSGMTVWACAPQACRGRLLDTLWWKHHVERGHQRRRWGTLYPPTHSQGLERLCTAHGCSDRLLYSMQGPVQGALYAARALPQEMGHFIPARFCEVAHFSNFI